MDLAVVLDEAQFPEFVHEKIDPGPSRANHLRLCSRWSARIISSFSMTSTVAVAIVVAVAIQMDWPARQPSPKKSPGPRVALAMIFLERHYNPWVHSRQEQLEADVASAWKLDPVLNQKIIGTNRVHLAKGPVN